MPLTWPKQRRILRRADFLVCYDQGERHFTRFFVIFAHVRGAGSPARVGFAVTRKCGNAVQRNRIKRVLREFFRLCQHDLPPLDIVVIPKKNLRADSISLSMVERSLAPVVRDLRQKFSLTKGTS